MQRGQIYKKNGSWLLRYWDISTSGRIRKATRLAPVGNDYPTKRSVLLLAEKILGPLNARQVLPESTLSVTQFIELHYLPHVQRELRASTYKDYKRDIYEKHLKTRLGVTQLRHFRTVDGQRILREIACPEVGHKTLLRIKSFLSGTFKHALREGFLDGVNPIQNVSVPGRPKKFRGEVYTMSEIEKIAEAVGAVDMRAFAVVSVAAFAGLRLAELRGIRWCDYDGQSLRVARSVWRTTVNEPKTESSGATVPVIPILQTILNEHRTRVNGNDDQYIFAGERRGAPLNLANLVRRVIQPALSKKSEKDEELIKWKGWHAFRRSLATNLYACGVAPKIVQAILRHGDVNTTLGYYVQTSDEESREALQKIEDWVKAV